MNLRFWLNLFFSFSICLLITALLGFALARIQQQPKNFTLFKRSVKLDSFLLLKQLNRKLDFLVDEAQKIQSRREISSGSPFFSLVISHQSQIEQIYSVESDPLLLNDEFKKAGDLKKSYKKEPDQKPVRQIKPSAPFVLKEDVIKELARLVLNESFPTAFHFKKVKYNEKNFTVLVHSFEENKKWLAFLKKNKQVLKWPLHSVKERPQQNKAFFAGNHKQIFFHSEKFKPLKKQVVKSLEELSQNTSLSGRYLTLHKKSGHKQIYYLQKWERGGLFLVNQKAFSLQGFPWLFFLSKDTLFISFALTGLIFILFFILFLSKIASLMSSYNFLKMAVLTFSKTGFFPPVKTLKNPWLYFYNNRFFILNKKREEDENKDTKSGNTSFQDILRQELKNFKAKFPHLTVKEEFDFDVRVFSFQKFLRAIIHELLLNAVEAMGGLKKAQLDLSLKKDGENLLFSIRDYGPGIKTKNYKKIFQMYYSTKSQLGVGLNLARSIIQANEGSLELSSVEAEGLKLMVRLPLKCFLKNH